MQKNGKLMTLSSVLPVAALGVFVMAASRTVAAHCDPGPGTCCYGDVAWSVGACINGGCYFTYKKRCVGAIPFAYWSSCMTNCGSYGS